MPKQQGLEGTDMEIPGYSIPYPGVCLLSRTVSLLSPILVPLITEAGLAGVMWSEQHTWFIVLLQFWSGTGLPVGHSQTAPLQICVPCNSFPHFWALLFPILIPPFLQVGLLSTKLSLNAFCLLCRFCCTCTQIWYFHTIASVTLDVHSVVYMLLYTLLDLQESAPKRSPIVPKMSLHLSAKLEHFPRSCPITFCEIQPSLTVRTITFVKSLRLPAATQSYFSCHIP